ncbi:MAG: HAD family hydrolase [bacterium]|nr:HAD family hydrolase [bacterium]
MKKPILSFDLDMTLLDHKTWEIPRSALCAIEQLRPYCRLVIATGRNLDDILGVPYQKQLCPDAVIHLNGSRITVGGTEIFHHFIAPEKVSSLISFAMQHDICLGAHVGEHDYFTHPEHLETLDRERFGESIRNFASAELLPSLSVHSMVFVGEDAKRKLLETQFPDFQFFPFAGGMMADISESGISKASGMQRLAAFWGNTMDDVVAFGDSMNDYELLLMAGTGVAMGNACEELKTIADYVTTDIDKDGVLHACQSLRLLEHWSHIGT